MKLNKQIVWNTSMRQQPNVTTKQHCLIKDHNAVFRSFKTQSTTKNIVLLILITRTFNRLYTL